MQDRLSDPLVCLTEAQAAAACMAVLILFLCAFYFGALARLKEPKREP